MPPQLLFDISSIDFDRVVLDVDAIERVNPHRGAMRLLDGVFHLTDDVGVAYHDVRHDAFWVEGHIPGRPIMPGVLVIEALAQVGGVLLSQALEHKGKVAILLSLDKVKFRRSVRPGDQLMLQVERIRVRSSTGHVRGRAYVAEELVAEAEIKFILTDAESR